MTIGSLFSGIGGLELGLERVGLGPVVWQAEREPFCRRVLRHHWPQARLFGSVQEVKHGRAERVSVLCGGFPCQPVSVAGKRLGADDDRWLWPECARIVREFDPEWCVFENVPGLRTRGLDVVLSDLAALGRDAEWVDLRASDVGAPHRRARLFIVAHRDGATLDRWRAAVERAVADVRERARVADPECGQLQRRGGPCELDSSQGGARHEGRRRDASEPASRRGGEALAHGHGHGREREREARVHDRWALGDDAQRCDPRVGERGFPPRPFDRDGWQRWLADGGPEPVVRGSSDGVPDRLDRLAALGNAVVPLVAEVVGRAIVEVCS